MLIKSEKETVKKGVPCRRVRHVATERRGTSLFSALDSAAFWSLSWGFFILLPKGICPWGTMIFTPVAENKVRGQTALLHNEQTIDLLLFEGRGIIKVIILL